MTIASLFSGIGGELVADGTNNFRLNPLYIEEMMGFPSMYLTYPFLSQDGEKVL